MKTEKWCNKCGQMKSVSDFNRNRTSSDGRNSWCKECTRDNCKKWVEKNRERHRENGKKWYKNNSEIALARAKEWARVNPEKCREAQRKWYKNNLETARERGKKWRDANPEKCREKKKRQEKADPEKWRERARRYAKKTRSTPKGKLNQRVSVSINRSLKGCKAGRSWESLVGYTVKDLMKHLKKQFKPGMSWENMGEWHIDHIIPKAVFNYETPEDIDFKKCWALKNIQPLWASENVRKHMKLDKPFQPSFIFQGGPANFVKVIEGKYEGGVR